MFVDFINITVAIFLIVTPDKLYCLFINPTIFEFEKIN